MPSQVQNINKVNTGLCPHGLPPGACPICSKMGGGGSLRAGERPQKAGEMSYHQCVMLGNLMRAHKLAQKRHAQLLTQNIEATKNFENLMIKISNNLQNFIQQMSNSFITKPIAFITQYTALPLINFIKNLPRIIQNFQNLRFEIQDKLNAIFGELKNFIQKKISDILQTAKNKLESLFKIFKKNNTNDDDTKIDDDKKIFNLKNILRKIIRKKKEKNDDSNKNKQ